MHFFSTPTFLAAAQAADPELAGARPTDVRVRGHGRYRVLGTTKGRLFPSLPFVDYLVALDDSDPSVESTADVRHLDNVVLDELTVDEFARHQRNDGLEATDPILTDGQGGRRTVSPYVEWHSFSSFEEYITRARSSSKRAFRETRRKVSLVERELGIQPTFTYDDPDPGRFEQCLRWKAQQYLTTGNSDLIAAGAGTLMRELRDADQLVISTLCAGDRLLAAHIGFVDNNVFHYWLPAYDDTAAKAAPGVRLLELMLAASFERNHAAFDFLEGQEAYKFSYATHVRVVGTIGTPSLALATVRRSRRRIGIEIRRRPRVERTIERIRNVAARHLLRR
ncbi:MAG: GNAT family N-acetyltransferase [Ilumatobacter sp.]